MPHKEFSRELISRPLLHRTDKTSPTTQPRETDVATSAVINPKRRGVTENCLLAAVRLQTVVTVLSNRPAFSEAADLRMGFGLFEGHSER
jgi:hypothetical protein